MFSVLTWPFSAAKGVEGDWLSTADAVVVTSSEDNTMPLAGGELSKANVDFVVCCSFVALSSGSKVSVVIGRGFALPETIAEIVVSLISVAGAFVTADVVVMDSCVGLKVV